MVPLNRPTRVLVVDDSALMREVLVKLLSNDPEIEVVGTARDGASGLAAVEKHEPDVITLDIEMPGLSGLEVLTRLRGKKVSVIVVASLAGRSCDLTVEALALGAFDFCPKPDGTGALSNLGPQLRATIKAAAAARRRISQAAAGRTGAVATSEVAPARTGPKRSSSLTLAKTTATPAMTVRSAGCQLIAIGASTGGPEALSELVRTLPANGPPVLIVQHMPEAFTSKFARRLNTLCAATVVEATDGAPLRDGMVFLAPGSRRHMILERAAHALVVKLVESEAVMHHRPSVDVLFRSCAEVLGRRTVAALLTGMGSDGACGLLALRNAGATTIAQDEATSVVYGMPMEAVAIGAASAVLPLSEIGPTLVRLSQGALRASSGGG